MPQITGTSGNDDLTGTPGDDIINGLAGADRMTGLGGNDVYYVDDAGDVIIEANGGGTDIVYASVGYTLNPGAWIELLTTPSIASTNPVDMTGNELDNTIWGNNGANTLSGGVGGHDTLVGFLGNDIYLINNTDEVVVENAGEGTDIVYVNSSYTLSANASIELLSTYSIAGTQAYDLTGNNLDNTIWGNRGNNTLSGGVGGHDTLVGFQGDDIYLINNTDEVIVENAGEGTDIVYVNSSYTLSANASIELLSTYSIAGTQPYNMTGNNLDNTIWGNRGDNTLSGGIGGLDTLVGFLGNDTYLVNNGNEVISELAGEGSDIVYAFVNYTLTAGASIELLSTNSIGGTNAINLTGNELANTIWGNGGSNVINGGGGSDTLSGFGGTDYFTFSTPVGPGNIDTITDFNPVEDRIVLDGGPGSPFALLAAGGLRANTFVQGPAALEADDYIIFNGATGALLYDADGNGAGAAVQIATLQGSNLLLNHTNFIVAGSTNQQPVVTSGTSATIAENSPISTIVYQTTATDADGDGLSYRIVGVDASSFSIDANGAVRFWASPNFEVKSSYEFFVQAMDSNTTSESVRVTVAITDVVENSTPIVAETAGDNNSYFVAQPIDRNTLLVASNPNLPDATLPSLTIQGSISSSADVDYYSITLQAGELLRLDVDGTNGLDSHLFVYYASQQLFGDNDDSDGPNDPGSNPPFDHNTDSSMSFRAPTTGTYYFKIVPFDPASFTPTTDGTYKINVSVGPVGTPAQIARENVDALISGDFWTHTNLTYGFPQQASQYPNDPQGNRFEEIDQLNPALPNYDNFQGFSALQIAVTQALLQIVASVTQLTFNQNSAQPGQADLRYAMSDEAEVAYAYYPTNAGPSSVGGSAWFNNTDAHFDNPIRGNYAWMGILHETGHALGLKHAHEFPWAVSLDRDTIEYSVMTYRSYVGAELDGYTNELYGYAQTLMQYDIAALQKIYGGANYTYNSGDSIYTWNSDTGEMSINGAPQGAPGNGVGGTANRILMTVWDGGGNDTYDLSNYLNGTTIDLRPGEWTKTSDVQTADLGDGRFARGNIANALLYLDNPASLIENAITGSGNDTLIANQAANRLTGGAGADVFKWASTGDGGAGVLADTILDFQIGTDKINFALLDANPATAAHDAFTFIGNSAFHNIAGEVRFDTIGGSAHVFADVDGNGTADMEIIVSNVPILAAGDFTF